MLPPALANFVNTLRSDVDATHRQVNIALTEAARLRVPDDRLVHETFDQLKCLLTARFLDLVKTGKLREIAGLETQGPTPAPGKPTDVKFPTREN
jgi:hypothetical protein